MDTVKIHSAHAAVVRIPSVRMVRAGMDAGSKPPLPGQGVDNLLLESGGNMLLEDGGVMLMEKQVVKQLN